MAEAVASLPGTRRHTGVLTALARQALRDARARTVAFAYLFAVYAYIQPVGYRHTYPTGANRRAFADSFAGNPGLRLLYGQPHQIDTTAGYTAWRVGGVLAIAAAAYGLLAAVRVGRAEEESGRTEVVLAAPVSRATANTAGLLAVAAGIALLGLAEFAGLVAAGIPAGGAAYLALASGMTAAVFTGIGALASQLLPTRRGALGLGARGARCSVRAADPRRHRLRRRVAALGDSARLGRTAPSPYWSAPLVLLHLLTTATAARRRGWTGSSAGHRRRAVSAP